MITITPTLRNRLVGYARSGSRDWKQFRRCKELAPSGLIGPVRLVTEQRLVIYAGGDMPQAQQGPDDIPSLADVPAETPDAADVVGQAPGQTTEAAEVVDQAPELAPEEAPETLEAVDQTPEQPLDAVSDEAPETADA